VPSAGGPRWLELVAEHSLLLSDQAEPAAQKASVLIERQHAALCQVAFRCDALPRQKLRVIALHDPGQFAQLYGSEASGAFSPELVYEPQLVLATGLSQTGTAQLSRVLSTLIAQQMLGPLPAWLLSGLASYFELAHFDAGGGFVIGDAVRRHVEQLAKQPRLGAELLLTQPPSAASDAVFAASSWLLVHYLQSERRADFAAFLASIASGQELSAAFHEAFPDLSPELLDGFLDHYQHAGNYLTQSKQIDLQPRAALVSPLSDADVYSVRAEVAAACAGCNASQRELQLSQALRAQPGHVRATILHAPDKPAPSLVSAHPESWLAWVHTAYTQPERACSAELRDHLQAIAPDNAHTLALAATCAQQAGQTDQALSLSKRAFSAYPISSRITLSHARILRAAGACAELTRLQEYAFDQDPSSPGRASLVSLGACATHKAP
jgi:tetratricopeptide (TPR) repeat protein